VSRSVVDTTDLASRPSASRPSISTFRNLEFYEVDHTTVLAVDRSSVVTIYPHEALAIGHISQSTSSPLDHRTSDFLPSNVEILSSTKLLYTRGVRLRGNKGILICGASAREINAPYALASPAFLSVPMTGLLRRDDRGVDVFAFPRDQVGSTQLFAFRGVRPS